MKTKMCQLELFEKRIGVKTLSCKGHQSFNIALCEANEFLLHQFKKLRLWLYVDGVQFDPRKIEVSTLSIANEIILTQALVGG
jgi:hypothetical protein